MEEWLVAGTDRLAHPLRDQGAPRTALGLAGPTAGITRRTDLAQASGPA